MSKADGASRIAELRRTIASVDSTAFLVESRVIRRIIRERLGFAKLTAALPHAQCQVVAGSDLIRWTHPDELGLETFYNLPETCLLLSEPKEGELEHWPMQELKQQVWRKLFHAQLDRALLDLESQRDPSYVQARIAEVGQVEFDEAHSVLRSEQRLTNPQSRSEAWRELVAHYLELQYFEPDLLVTWFPSLIGLPRIEEILSRDLSVPAMYESSRLEGASSPDLTSHAAIDDAKLLQTRHNWSLGLGARQSDRSYLWQLRRRERANERGNTVQAAASAMEASQRATSDGKREAAEVKAIEDVRTLVGRLQVAINFPEEDCDEWQASLWELVKNSIHGFWNADKRLLYDLQKVCLDHERVTYKIDIVKWLVSRGQRPFRRPLTNLREVAMAKHLASAASRLVYVRLSGMDRERLTELIQNAAALSEKQMRERMRPILRKTLMDVRLSPENIPEKVAFEKLVEDSLDCIASRGYLSMGYLRDAVSKNDLKLSDLQEVRELWSGDRLLQTDDRLDIELDGVYRRGEFYLRWLQWVSAMFFGTRLGRFTTLYLIMPFGGAVLIVEGVRHVVHLFQGKGHHESEVPSGESLAKGERASIDEESRVSGVAEASKEGELSEGEFSEGTPSDEVVFRSPSDRPAEQNELEIEPPEGNLDFMTDFLDVEKSATTASPPRTTDEAVDQILSRQTDALSMILVLGFLLMALIHVPNFRRVGWVFLQKLGSWIWFMAFTVPSRIIQLPWFQAIWKSIYFVRFRRYVFTPMLLAYLTTNAIPLMIRSQRLDWWWSLTIAILLSGTLNSRLGQDAQELTTEWLGSVWHRLRAQLLLAILDWVVDIFRFLLHSLERLLYAVDEWLRFHNRENWLSIMAKAILGVIWSFCSFLIRIYVNLLIEPTFHPVKHFPVVTVAHKIFLPALIMLEGNMVHFLGQYLGTPLARSVTWFNIFFLPGFFGFAVWELKENWRLFRANRKPRILPIAVGSHGETVARLLRPGFHSGTLPKIFRKLRGLEGREASFRRFVQRRAAREQLHHVELAIQSMVRRELIELMSQCSVWKEYPIHCSHIRTFSNSLAIELECPAMGDVPLVIVLQEQSGWIVASLPQYGWLKLGRLSKRTPSRMLWMAFIASVRSIWCASRLSRIL